MKLNVSLVLENKILVSAFLFFSLSLLLEITALGQTLKDCVNCSCCGEPARCAVDSVFRISCEKAPNCNCDCNESSCNCFKNICDVTCYPVSDNKNNNKSLEIGLITLSLIINEPVTTDDLEENSEAYAFLIEKLLSNKISENTYQVEYETRLVKLGFAKSGLRLITQFKENLKDETQNSQRRSKNIFVIIWQAITRKGDR
jgi:hypothetical protein